MLLDEDLISLTQAAEKFPGHRGAKRLHPATLTRWILKGVRGTDGRIVKLEALRFGARWFTSESALRRFSAALTAAGTAAGTATDTPPARTPTARQSASERAAAELRAMGA
jgi:hypothetical protein